VECDDVREHLAEHLLGSLPEDEEGQVRRHLRGCMACRRELAVLDEGMRTFARAAHQVDPPEALRSRVLGALAEEKEEAEAAAPKSLRRNPSRLRRFALATAAVLVLGSAVGVAAAQTHRANQVTSLASTYQHFLGALGGKDVRAGTFSSNGPQDVQGSVVMYDSDQGQSWVLVMARAPGLTGKAQVEVSSATRQMELHPLRFDSSGNASSWLVTANDLSKFDTVRIVGPTGSVLATANLGYH
jgi:putative zinc finger protein